MPILRGCCCFDLKTGSKIIGVTTLILELFGFLTVGLSLIFFLVFENFIYDELSKIRNSAAESGSKNTFSLELDRRYDDPLDRNLNRDYDHDTVAGIRDEELKEALNTILENFYLIKIVLLVIVALQLIDIIASSCLIHGIRTNRRGLMVPFIFLHTIYVIIEIALLVLIAYAYAMAGMWHAFFVVTIINIVIFVPIHTYLTLVVISDFQALGLILMHPSDEMCLK